MPPSAPAGPHPGAGGPPSVVVTGRAAGWLALLVGDADGPVRLDPPGAGGPAARLPVSVRVDDEVARRARAAGRLRLLDSEGAPLADVTDLVTVPTVAEPAAGALSAEDGPWHVGGLLHPLERPLADDYLDLRRRPVDLRREGPWALLWAAPPASTGLRAQAGAAARSAGLPLLRVATLDPARWTEAPAHLAARLGRVQAAGGDRVALLAVPALPAGTPGALAQVAVAAACGARLLLLDPARLAPPVDAGAVHAAAAAHGLSVRELAGGPDAPAGPEVLAAVDAAPGADALPGVLGAAELAEVRAVHRPPARRGYTVLLTGLSGSGKSTVARRLVARLLEHEHRSVTLLDGDVVRLELSRGLGFSRADREANVRRLGFVAAEVTKAGGAAVCCPIAPEDRVRKDVRAMVEAHGVFVLVHVATPLAECERRDRKGLYARARAGLVPEFTGISAPYEPPADAEIVLDTSVTSLDDCVEAVLSALRTAGLLA